MARIGSVSVQNSIGLDRVLSGKTVIISICNLCGGPIITLNSTASGTRCLVCRSIQVHRSLGVVVGQLTGSYREFIYELSSRGAWFRFAKKNFANLYFSEWFDNYPNGLLVDGVPCQDVQQLVLGNELFDFVTSTEVFEHVPNDALGFSEVHRVLNRGGYFVFTVPLDSNQANTSVRASVDLAGNCIYHLEAQYHNDRIKGKGTALVFRNYGVDILDKLDRAGFNCQIEKIENKKMAIRNQLVVVAQKI